MVLERRQKYNLILSEDEKKLLKGFIQLLEPFELFTIGAQANKYPTINMELLYRIEIEQRLTEIEQRAFRSAIGFDATNKSPTICNTER